MTRNDPAEGTPAHEIPGSQLPGNLQRISGKPDIADIERAGYFENFDTDRVRAVAKICSVKKSGVSDDEIQLIWVGTSRSPS